MFPLMLPDYAQALLIRGVTLPVIFIGLLAVGRVFKRRFHVRLGAAYKLFAISAACLVTLVLSPAPFAYRVDLVRHLSAITLLTGTLCFLAIFRRFFWEGWYPQVKNAIAPKFLSEILSLLVFLLAGLVVFGGIYAQSIQGALFGSTVVIGIVGFAMQDLLGNVIAGIALELGKPFRVGDWLIVESRHAEVIEVNWRSTRLRTTDDVYLDIPNKAIVGSAITNLTFPAKAHAIRMSVALENHVPPNLCKELLERAAAEVPHVLPVPAARVYLKDFADSANVYEIKFWIEDEARFTEIMDRLRTNVWYAVQRAGLKFPFPVRSLHMEQPAARQQASDELAKAAARKHPFLKLLDDDQAGKLLSQARFLRFGRGEKLIVQGDGGQSMFILVHGEADVLVRSGAAETMVAQLTAGDFCGEMSLLTGEPRSATVVGRTDCEVWEIDKHLMAELLHENQALVQRLSEMLAARRLATEGVVASAANRNDVLHMQEEYTAGFFKKVCSFFEL